MGSEAFHLTCRPAIRYSFLPFGIKKLPLLSGIDYIGGISIRGSDYKSYDKASKLQIPKSLEQNCKKMKIVWSYF